MDGLCTPRSSAAVVLDRAGERSCRAAARPWRGEAFVGQTLLLGGPHDVRAVLRTLHLAMAARQGGGTVILQTARPLVRLLARSACVDRVIATGEWLPSFDLFCPVVSLADRCTGAVAAALPASRLRADAEQARTWRRRFARLDGIGPRIGLAWQEGPDGGGAGHDILRFLARGLPDASFHLLGIGTTGYSRTPLPSGLRVVDHRGVMGDFDDLAAVVMALDLVVSASDAVAVLAGSLGRPALLLENDGVLSLVDGDRHGRQTGMDDRSDSVGRWAAELLGRLEVRFGQEAKGRGSVP